MTNIKLAYRCFAVLLVALLAGCGGGGGGGSVGTLPTSSTVQTSSPTSTQTGQMALNLQYGTTGKIAKTASGTTVGLPSSTVNVRIHIINPTTGADVVAPVLAARTAGATTQTVTIPNVPYGIYQVVVESLGAADVSLGFFHNNNVRMADATVTVAVDTSATLTSLAILPTTATIGVGTTQVFLATGTFSDNSAAVVNSLASWASSATTVAGVSAGTAVGLTAGSSTITAFLTGQVATASLTVTGTIPSPSPSPSPSGSPTYVGSTVCGQCHVGFPPANGYHAGDAYDSSATSNTYMDLAAMGSIYNNYVASIHYTPNGSGTTDFVRCEGCHGPGSLHYGVGPLPYPLPGIAQCGGCHDSANPGTNVAGTDTIDVTAFNQTLHANPNAAPDKFFFQGGNGTSQSTVCYINDQVVTTPEWKDAAGTQAVSKNEKIEECSVCHTPHQKATHIAAGDLQNPPQVACAGCHDAHEPAQATRNVVKTSGALTQALSWMVPNLSPVQVNSTAGTSMYGAMNKNSGTWIRPRLYFAYNALADGSPDPNTSFGGNSTTVGYYNQQTAAYNTSTSTSSAPLGLNPDWLRTTSERLCAGCHTVGNYKYGGYVGNPGSTTAITTHQEDVFSQFYLSAHFDKNHTGPTKSWSLMTTRMSSNSAPVASVYTQVPNSKRPYYPMDMGGRVGQSAYTADGRTVTPVPGDATAKPRGWGDDFPNYNDPNHQSDQDTNFTTISQFAPQNWRCLRCHHGIAAIDYAKGVQYGNAIGDKPGQAHILWGDSAKTCITCHDPHKSGTGATKNVRRPVYQSYHDIPVGWSGRYNMVAQAGCFTPAMAPTLNPSGATRQANVRGGVAAMLDLSPIPAEMGNNGICTMCHQGRESGWTVWNQMRYFRENNVSKVISGGVNDTAQAAADFFFAKPDDQIDPSGLGYWSTVNAHDLAAAGIVWGRNSLEMPSTTTATAWNTLADGTTAVTLPGTFDDGIPKHREQGCTGCHMANSDLSNPADPLGGHTWNVNVVTCQQCHAGLTRFQDVNAKTDYDGSNGVNVTVGQKFGGYVLITAHTNVTPSNTTYNHTNVWTNTAVGGTGLIGWINRALYDGIPVKLTTLPLKTTTNVATYITDATISSGYVKFTTPHVVRIHLEMSSSAGLKAWAGEDLTYAANHAGLHFYYNQYVGLTNAGTLAIVVSPRIDAIYFNLYQLYSACGSLTANGFTNAAYAHDAIFVAQTLIDVLSTLGKTTNPTTSLPFVRPVQADSGTTHTARNYRDATTYGGPQL